MRYSRFCLSLLLGTLLSFSFFAHAQQPWSGILSSSRAIDWTKAGLPATLPDGETTSNPWTPPTRTQCGSTVTAGTSLATINSDLAACANGTYVLLGPGTFAFSSGTLALYAINSVTLRGSGAQSTIVALSGSATIGIGAGWGAGSGTLSLCNGASVTGANCQGVNNVQLSSVNGLAPTVGNIMYFSQCNTGLSGADCATGTQTDNGGVYVCASPSASCAQQTSENNQSAQAQTVYITKVTGSGPYTVTFSSPIYMPNWSSDSTATANWQDPSHVAMGMGLEDMTVVECVSSSTPGCTSASTASPSGVYIQEAYASWIKGVRFIGSSGNDTVYLQSSKNSLLANNYFFSDLALDGADGGNIGFGHDSDDLIINNIGEFGFFDEGTGGQEGDVLAYNYSAAGNAGYVQSSSFQHQGGSAFILHEGNNLGVIEDDDTWGTHDFNTFFRNYVRGWDPPYTSYSCCERGLLEDSFSRFGNLIGNVIDSGNGLITNYLSTVSSPQSQYFAFGFYSNNLPSDPLTQASAMLWGNCDTVNATCRFTGSEVPSNLAGNAAPYGNTVPASNNLPCSFFLAGYTSTTCTPHSSGGTGLSWWKVCKTWSTFPTACSSTQTQPFPFAGPDVSSGPHVNGTAYDNPASVAWQNLPLDPTYQGSYSITSSSWSGGTETLTVSGIPNAHHLMGKFQVSGGACATSGAGTSTGAEVSITSSTATTVSYALASDPGNCASGTMKFPDVRLFDERVYQTDSGGGGSTQPSAPGGLTATVQ